jgi:hypothetical protein
MLVKRTWSYWRGSPEHVRQVARVAVEALNRERNCYVVIASPPYKEVFRSPEEFKTDLKRISIVVIGHELQAQVRFNTQRARKGSSVLLRVRSQTWDVDWTKEAPLRKAYRRLEAAIGRGVVSKAKDRTERVVIFTVSASVYIATLWSVSTLSGRLKHAAQDGTVAKRAAVVLDDIAGAGWSLGAAGASLVAGIAAVMTQFLRPRVEVAPLGQTRLFRWAKAVGPWLGGIIAAGIIHVAFKK